MTACVMARQWRSASAGEPVACSMIERASQREPRPERPHAKLASAASPR